MRKQQKAVDLIKQEAVSDKILIHYIFQFSLISATDVIPYEITAILDQKDLALMLQEVGLQCKNKYSNCETSYIYLLGSTRIFLDFYVQHLIMDHEPLVSFFSPEEESATD